jgi:hypothetical protein
LSSAPRTADGDVTLTDLAIVLTEFGRVCP